MLRNRRLGRRAVVTLAGAAAVTAGAVPRAPWVRQGERAGDVVGDGHARLARRGVGGAVGDLVEGPCELAHRPALRERVCAAVGGMEVVLEAHNFYLTTLLRTGAIGLLALIVLTGGLLRVLWRTPAGGSGGLLGVDVFPALLVMQLIWLVTWTPGIEQGIITGLAVALATARVRGSTTTTRSPPWTRGPAMPCTASAATAGRQQAPHRRRARVRAGDRGRILPELPWKRSGRGHRADPTGSSGSRRPARATCARSGRTRGRSAAMPLTYDDYNGDADPAGSARQGKLGGRSTDRGGI